MKRLFAFTRLLAMVFWLPVFMAFLFSIALPERVFSQTWLWLEQNAANVSSSESTQYLSVATDPAGDVYVSGFYCGPSPSSEGIPYTKRTITGAIVYEKMFMPAAGTICLGIGYDIAVAGSRMVIAGTYDSKPLIAIFNPANGNHLTDWLFAGTGNVRGMDFRSGKFYVIGNYKNTLNLGNGFSLAGSTNNGVFVAVFDENTGNCVAATRLSSAGDIYGYDLKTDASGNVYITGHANANVTFHGSTSSTYTHSGGQYSSFCAKLAPSLNMVWASKTAISNYSIYGNSQEFPVALDPTATAVYTGGLYSLNKLDPANGSIQATDPQANKFMDDIAVSSCAVFTVGTTVGFPFFSEDNPENFIPCDQVPTLFYLTKNDLSNCTQIAIENSTNACAGGSGVVINHLNDPVCCGIFSSIPPMNLGPFSLFKSIGDRGVVAMFDDDCPAPGPCNPDLTPPVFTSCPTDQTINIPCNTSPCGPATYAATATDSCALQSLTYNYNPGYCFPLGTTTVVCTATDMAGNTKTCSFSVTVACAPPCTPTNICLDFDGTDDFVDVPNPLNTPALQNNFSVACWFRNDRNAGAFFYRLFGFAWNGPRFEVGEQNGLLTLFTSPGGTSQSVIIRDGIWHHLAAVVSGGSVTIYLDCAPVINVTNQGPFTGTPQNFHIGDWAGVPGSGPSFWEGRIDEFKVWGTALTQAEVCDAKDCSLDPKNANLLIHFPFDENIPGGPNPGKFTATNVGTAGSITNGTLTNFTLNGNRSNWVARGRDQLPNCNVDYFAWLEGNPGRNIPGRTKVYEADIFTAGVEVIQPPNQKTAVAYPIFTRRFPNGTIDWRTVINIPGVINDFVRTDGGCYLLVGHTPNFAGNNRSFTALIDNTGVLVWLHQHDLAERESFHRIIRSDNPSDARFPYTVCGIRKNAGTTRDDILLFTMNDLGAIDWMRQIGDIPTDDEFRFDLMNYGGGYLLTGPYINAGLARPVLFHTDKQGFQTASTEYQANINFLDIEPAATGTDIIIAGQLTSGGAILARVTASGAQVWAKRFPDLTAFRKVLVQPNGDIYAVGQRNAIGLYRNVFVKVRDLPGGVLVDWQKYAELTSATAVNNNENNWTAADLVWYSGKMFFFTDGRVNHSNGWGNEDIGAVMYELGRVNDICPLTKEVPVSQNFTLIPASMPVLPYLDIMPPAPLISNPWYPLAMERDSLCADRCQCSFTKMWFRKGGNPNTKWTVSVPACGLPPFTLPGCPEQTIPIYFSGKLQCKGNCAFGGLTWTLTNPNTTQVFSGISLTGAFTVPITLNMVQAPGTYTLLITGKCGAETCTCMVQFTVPPCPKPCDCAEPAFTYNTVYPGFNWVQSPGCQFKFIPKFLTDCDQVIWKVALSGSSTFTTFATSVGNQSVNYTFPATNQYVVCWTVTRTPTVGAPCTQSRCWTIDVDCTLFKKPGDDHPDNVLENDACAGSVVQNEGFTIGAEAGGMAEEGTVWNWDFSAGNPEVVLEPGKADINLVRLRGNGSFADMLYQDSLAVGAERVHISLAFRPISGLVLPGTDLVVRISSQRQDSIGCNDESACKEILRVPIPDSSGTTWLLAGAYDSTTFIGSYLTIQVENPFVDDDVALKSVVDIDNVCLRTFNFVDTDEPAYAQLHIQLYPNPTSGHLNIRIDRPLGEQARLRIFDIRGQMLRENILEKGETTHSLNLNTLPPGLYIIEIQSNNSRPWRGKIVKQ